MIQIENLTRYYGDFCAVDNISLEIRKGEILGLLGPNGAGKSTTLRMLTCYMLPSEGTISVKDYNIYEHALEIKKMIGYLPESAPLYQDMLVMDYLHFVAGVREIPEDRRNKRIVELANLCGLNAVMHKSVHELSKGYKQRVGLAHAMMSDPEILVLDEPTSGLDPNQIVEIRDIIREIGKEKTVILSTHILSEAEATCDRIVIINKGKIAADDKTENLKSLSGKSYSVHVAIKGHHDGFADAVRKIAEVKDVVSATGEDGATDFIIQCDSDKDIREDVFAIVKNNNWSLIELHREKKTLEHIFRELTKEN